MTLLNVELKSIINLTVLIFRVYVRESILLDFKLKTTKT